MVKIKLPDGSVREYDGAISAGEVAAEIGPGLAKAAIVAKADGELIDLSLPLTQDTDLAIVTRTDDDALEVLRPGANG